MLDVNYNPDVLSCLANLSNDEVFTPPDIANQMLDLLPEELWSDKNATFLDPATKSGVFLREIAKRLMVGLEKEISDLQSRVDHIMTKQLFGIGITELTSLLARRSVYCSKAANGEFSICEEFDEETGNIFFDRVEHEWKNGKCIHCGASQKNYSRDSNLETHAYQFIHGQISERIKNMKFDVIIGNPPYQLNVGVEKKNYAIMIFQKFVEISKRLSPRYISMIIPARWYTGGRGLSEFRKNMLADERLSHIVDFPNSRECFDNVDIAGGAMYFLWDKSHSGLCKYTSVIDGERKTKQRKLNARETFIRFIDAETIVDKVCARETSFLSDYVSVQTPFGFHSNFWDKDTQAKNDVTVRTSKGMTFTDRDNVRTGKGLIDKYKVIITKATSEHAGQASNDGKRKILATIDLLEPGEVCSQTYLVVNSFDNRAGAINLVSFLKTRLARFLLLQAISSQDLSRDKFCFVPNPSATEHATDEALFEKYDLTENERRIILFSMKEIP